MDLSPAAALHSSPPPPRKAAAPRSFLLLLAAVPHSCPRPPPKAAARHPQTGAAPPPPRCSPHTHRRRTPRQSPGCPPDCRCHRQRPPSARLQDPPCDEGLEGHSLLRCCRQPTALLFPPRPFLLCRCHPGAACPHHEPRRFFLVRRLCRQSDNPTLGASGPSSASASPAPLERPHAEAPDALRLLLPLARNLCPLHLALLSPVPYPSCCPDAAAAAGLLAKAPELGSTSPAARGCRRRRRLQ